MVEKDTFMETVRSVQEIARTSQTPLDRETLLSYFQDMDLSPQQEDMICQFLMLPPEETETAEQSEEQAEGGSVQEDKEETHFQMYLDEINEITQLEGETEERLYRELMKGDTSVISAISVQWLKRVVAIAKEYEDRGYSMDDLVQEGNMGLLMELHALSETGKTGAVPSAALIPARLRNAVKEAMEQYLGEESGEEQQNETILGKVSLVHAAQQFLTEEKGTAPSLAELAEYTKIPEEEITDILALIRKKE